MTRLSDLILTSQELVYLASGARALAVSARADADRQQNPSLRDVFEVAERTYLELAAKCEHMAELARATSKGGG